MQHLAAGFIALALALSATALAAQQSTTGQAQTAALTVSTTPARQETWPVTIAASGWLAPWQEAVVSAEISGQRITAINADVGAVVRKGDVLAELSVETLDNDIVQKEAAVASAAAALEAATSDGDRARSLTGSSAISKQQITEYLVTERKAQADLAAADAALASARLDRSRSQILAVDDGMIASRSAALGAVVNAGDELFRLIRQSRIEWQAEIPLKDMLKITEGTRAVIPTPFGDVQGQVRLIAPTVSSTSGRVTVYVSLVPPQNAPSPKTGIVVTGYLVAGQTPAVTVPNSALTLRDGFSYVFVLNPGDPATVSRKRVETGRRQGDRVEITAGLGAGAEVVQAGGAFLADGSVVRVVPTTQTATQPNTGTPE